jgi:Ca2+-binding RTX toxin-like protein
MRNGSARNNRVGVIVAAASIATALVIALPASAAAAPWATTTSFERFNGEIVADGDGGVTAFGQNASGDLSVIRFDATGAVDQSFAGGELDTEIAVSKILEVEPLTGGYLVAYYDNSFFGAAIKVLDDGTVDQSFGTSGVAQLPNGCAAPSGIVANEGIGEFFVVITADGNCSGAILQRASLATGEILQTETIDSSQFPEGQTNAPNDGIYVLTDDGIMRISKSLNKVQRFGNSGTAVLPATPSFAFGEAADIATDGNGRVVAAFMSQPSEIWSPCPCELVVTAIDGATGEIDTSFGDQGIVSLRSSNNNVFTNVSVEVGAGDRIIVTSGMGTDKGFIAQLNPDGSFDERFAGNGRRVLNTLGILDGVAFGTEIITIAQSLDDHQVLRYDTPAPRCSGRDATHWGTAGADTILGTSASDVIVGFAGADRIDGRGGNDYICPGGGRDTVIGGPGGDRIIGGSGDDTLRGKGGRDTLLGQGGNDGLFGGTGNDRCIGGPGVDTGSSCEIERGIP